MPTYIYEKESTGEVVEIFQHMSDEHIFRGPNGDEEGQWRRVWTVPQACIDSSSAIDPFSSRDFVEKTGKKKGKMADLYEQAAEASSKRIDKLGHDPIKSKFLSDYRAQNGVEHFSVGKTNKITKNGITVDLAAK